MQRVAGGGDTITVTGTPISDPWTSTVTPHDWLSVGMTADEYIFGFDGGGETWSGGGGSEQETAEETPEDKASEEGIDLKDGVEIDDMSDEMQDALDDIADAWDEHASDITPVITSGNEGTDGDGVHMDGSKHYTGDAVDLRTNNLTQSQIDDVSSTLSSSLGDDYDGVVESTHIHVEYDPA
ncbi:MAG: hypothetical protein RIA71_10155 [Oceanicaulis sp.]